MITISQKTLDDLEFDAVVAQIASFSITQLGKAKIQQLKPYGNQKDAVYMLDLTHEFISSFENENRIPNHGFEDIAEELKLLRIENNFLEVEQFRKIASLSSTTNVILKFFKKFHEYYPLLFERSEQQKKHL